MMATLILCRKCNNSRKSSSFEIGRKVCRFCRNNARRKRKQLSLRKKPPELPLFEKTLQIFHVTIQTFQMLMDIEMIESLEYCQLICERVTGNKSILEINKKKKLIRGIAQRFAPKPKQLGNAFSELIIDELLLQFEIIPNEVVMLHEEYSKICKRITMFYHEKPYVVYSQVKMFLSLCKFT